MAFMSVTGLDVRYNPDDSVNIAGRVTLEIFAKDGDLEYTHPFWEFGDTTVEFEPDEFYRMEIVGARYDDLSFEKVFFTNGTFATYASFYDYLNDREYLFEFNRSSSNTPNLPQSNAQLQGFIQSVASFDFVSDSPSTVNSLDLSSWRGATFTENDMLVLDTSNTLKTFDMGFGDDTVYAQGDFYDISGGQGDDRLVVRGDKDGFSTLTYIDGGDGNDILKVKFDLEGVIAGGFGDDKIVGADLQDTLDGGTGTDILIGLDGGDSLDGDEDRDFLYGGKGDDSVFGGLGDDELRGNRGNDSLYGGEGVDDIRGGGNDDQLLGDEGNDYLFGENGRDRLDGGAGDDVLTGGAGGGTGDGLRDVFVYATDTAQGYDRIRDFEDGIDLLDLVGTQSLDFAEIYGKSADVNGGLRIKFDPGQVIFIENFTKAEFDASDVIL